MLGTLGLRRECMLNGKIVRCICAHTFINTGSLSETIHPEWHVFGRREETYIDMKRTFTENNPNSDKINNKKIIFLDENKTLNQ